MPMPEIKPEKGILLITAMLIALVSVLKLGIAHVSDAPAVDALRDPFVAEMASMHEGISTGRLVLPRRRPSEEEGVPPEREVRVPILVYHSVREPVPGMSAFDRQFEVTPDQFERQVSYLHERGFHTVSFGELADAFDGDADLPEKPVVISFDDGRETQFTNAVPILERFGYTATFFVFTNAIDRDGYLTWDQLQQAKARGMEIGSHTVFHPFLTRMTSDEAKREEIEKSKATLERGLGVHVTAFAHPFGLYDDATNALIEAAGYRTARTLVHDQVHTRDERYALGAYIVTANFSAFREIVDAE